jgi:VanZ family protein
VQDRNGRIDQRFALITAAFVLVIVYGSLFPFHFRGNPDANGPIRALIDTWRGPFGRGDFLANVLLYLPLGLFCARSLPHFPFVARISVVILGGTALSACMELLQFYDEGRVSSLSDVYANAIGVAAGSVASGILFRGTLRWRAWTINRRPFVILLLASWLGYRLFPFLPVIDLHKYWAAVKPLVISPVLSPLGLYRHAVVWLVVGLLVESLVGIARSRLLLPLLVTLVLLGRILILDAFLSPAEVAGALLAVAAWHVFLSRLEGRAKVIAALFAGAVAIDALEPFQFSARMRPFGWVPFQGFINGSLEVNIRSFFEKVFAYGALIWLIARAGSSLTVAVILSSGLVMSLRMSQVFLPGRSAEITDLIMLLLVAAVMNIMGENPTPVSPSKRGRIAGCEARHAQNL